MARNKSETLPRVIHKKIWMPLDEWKKTRHEKSYASHNQWEDKGGSWAFVVQYTPNSHHRKYEVWTQCHRGYKDNFSIRSFDRLGETMEFWGLLDEGPQFRDLPKPPDRRPSLYRQQTRVQQTPPAYEYETFYKAHFPDDEHDGHEWPIVKSGEWDGLFPNGSHGHHDGPRSKGGY